MSKIYSLVRTGKSTFFVLLISAIILSINFRSYGQQLTANAGGASTVICSGGSAIIGESAGNTASGGTAPYTYKWSPSADLNSNSIANPIASPTETTTYTVTVTDNSAATATDAIVVIVTSVGSTVSFTTLKSSYCKSDASFTLTGSPVGGVFSYNGVSGSNTFDPGALPVGLNTVSYSYAEPSTVSATIFIDNFSSDKGWTQDPGSVWERNQVKAVNQNCAGSKDPTSDHSGEGYIIGNNIGGCYPSIAAVNYMTSPVINCTGMTGVVLNFWSNSSIKVSDHFTIEAKDTSGTWVKVWPLISTILNESSWTPRQVFLSQADNNPNFQLRFGIGPTDNLSFFKGWNIDDIALYGNTSVTCTQTVSQTTTIKDVPANANPITGTASLCQGTSGVLYTTTPVANATSYSWTLPTGATIATGSGTDSITVDFSTSALSGNITVAAVNSCGLGVASSFAVTVNSLPTITVNSPTICNGATATLTANGGSIYSWSTLQVVNPITVSPTVTTTYTITGTTASGCTGTAQSVVTVNSNPVVTVNNPTICQGSSATLTAAGATTYSWTTSEIINPITLSPVLTTTYKVTGTTSGCTGTALSTVTVNPFPSPAVGGVIGIDSVCQGQKSVTYSINPIANATSYHWVLSPDMTIKSGAGTNTIVVDFSATATKDTLYVYGVNACGNGVASNIYIVKVNPAPAINVGNKVICNGANATLTASGAGVSGTYSWSTSQTINPIVVSPAATKTYTVTGTTTSGCKGTAQSVITVNSNPTVTVNNATVCNGTSATLKANAPTATSFLWNTTATIDSIVVTPPVTSTYYVTVKDINNCTAVGNGVATVNLLPNVTANATSTTLCKGTNDTLTGGGATSYVWNNGVTNGVAFAPAATQTYTVTGTDINNCKNTASVIVTVNPVPTVTANANSTVCAGTSVKLTGGGANTYLWNNGVIDGIAFVPAATQTYTVTGTDINNCTNTASTVVKVNPLPTVTANATSTTICKGTNVTLTGGGANTYLWNNGIINGVAFAPASTQTYTVTGTDINNCTNTASTVVTVNNINPTAKAARTAICLGDTTQLTATGGVSYIWSPTTLNKSNIPNPIASPNGTTNYQVTVTDNIGCTAIANVVVTVNVLPTISAGPDKTLCSGASSKIITVGSPGIVTYSWSPVIGLSAGNAPQPIVTAVSTQTYHVTVTDGSGCTATSSLIVTVPTPTVTINSGTNISICNGSSTSLTANPLPASGNPYTFAWSPATGLSSTNTKTTQASPNAITTYTVIATDTFGCTATNSIIITISANGVANAGKDTSVCFGSSVRLSGSGGAGASTYLWTGPNLSQLNVTNPLAQPVSDQQYILQVTYTNGCVSKDTVLVKVNSIPVVTVNNPTICDGKTVTLQAQGANTYKWNNGKTTDTINVNPNTNTTYTVTGTSNWCTNTTSSVVTVNPTPVASLGADQTICYGKTATLTALPAGMIAYAWDKSPLTSQSITVSPTTTTTFTVTVINGFGCTDQSSVVVNVDTLPSATAGNNQIICYGGSTMIDARGGSGYLWSPSNSLSSANVRTPIASPTQTTTYTVTITATNGCSTSGQLVVMVNKVDSLIINGLDSIYCVDGSTSLLSGTPAGGTFSGPGVIINTFDPALAGVGTHNIMYKYTQTFQNQFTVFYDDFSTDQIGKNNQTWVGDLNIWKRGPAVGGTLCDGNTSGPLTDHSPTADNYIASSNIGNCYANNMNSTKYFISPFIDCSNLINVKLDFWSFSGFQGHFSDSATIDVTDNAGNWKNIYTNPGGKQVETQWTYKNYDVSAYANNNPNFRIRFGIGPTNSDSAFAGWNIDDLSVYGLRTTQCTDSVIYTTRVDSMPVVNINNTDTLTTCFNYKTTLTANVTTHSNPGLPTYKWNTGETTQSITFNAKNTQYYTLSVTQNNCMTIQRIYLVVNPLPNVNAGTDQTICYGDSTTLIGSGLGTTYAWNDGTNTFAQDSLSPVVRPTVNTTYTLSMTGNNGCTALDTMIVIVNPLPPASAGPDRTICLYQFDSLSASGGVAYKWNTLTGLSDSLIPNPKVNPTVTTIYTVTVTSAQGCTESSAVAVYVNDLPKAWAHLPQTMCTGDSITLRASPDGAISYNWNNGAGSGQSVIVSPATTTTYMLTVTDQNLCSNTSSVVVTVNPVPVVSAGSDTLICLHKSATLTATGGGVGGTYKWSPATGLNITTDSVVVASPATTTNYVVTVQNGPTGCTATSDVTVVVTSLPLTYAGADDFICQGDSLQLIATGADSVGGKYIWSPVTGLTNPNISNPIALPTVTTTYTVTATNIYGCSESDNIVVTVYRVPKPILGNDTSICMNGSITLTADGGGSGGIYSWNTSDIGQSITVSPSVATTYTVVITDSTSCTATGSVVVRVNPLPTVNAGQDKSICQGSQTALNAIATGPIASYQWTPTIDLSNPGISNPIASPSISTAYFVMVKDSNGCKAQDTVSIFVNPLPVADGGTDKTICFGQSDTLIATGGGNYAWSNGSNSDTLIVNPTITTVYSLTVTDPLTGCLSTADVMVRVNPLPPAFAGADNSICAGDTLQLQGTLGVKYVWAPANSLTDYLISNPRAFPAATTTYSMTVTDANGCSASNIMVVIVNPLPNASAGNDATICLGGVATLTASGGGLYLWSTGESTPSIDVSPVTTTTYSVTVTDNITFCPNTATVKVIVNPLPIANAGGDRTVCLNDSAQLTASGGNTYQWSPVIWLSNPNLANTYAKPASTITYTVTVTDVNGCTAKDNSIVVVNSLPVAFAGRDTAICLNNSVQLTATGGINYKWSPSTGLNDVNINNPVASPTVTTTYVVTVTDVNNCSNTDNIIINVNLLPVAYAGADQAICFNGTGATLNASGGGPSGTYSWSPGTGLTPSAVVINPVANPATSTSYTVTVTDGNGCTATDGVNVIVKTLPNASAGINRTICFGDSITIKASPDNATYLWSPGGVNVIDSAVQNLIVKPTTATTYTVTVTMNGCSASDNMVVDVFALPSITISQDTTVCLGTTVNLFATGGVNYRWSTGDTIANININPLVTSTYFVTVTGPEGCSATDNVKISVNPLPVISAGNDTALCIGSSITLNPTLPAGTYLWLPSTGLSSTTIAAPIANPTVATTYTVFVTDVNGCTAIDNVTVNVNEYPVVNVTKDTVICKGNSIDLRATGADTYSWNYNSLTTQVINVQPVTTTSYTVTGYTNGCGSTAGVNVKVNDYPLVNAGVDASICFGDSTQLKATTLATTYKWTPSTGLNSDTISNPIAKPAATTSYVVMVTIEGGCTAADTVVVNVNQLPSLPLITGKNSVIICRGNDTTLTAKGGGTYLWDDGSTNPVRTVTPTTATTYHVTVTDIHGCINADSVSVSLNELPVANAGVDRTICKGDTISLMVTSSVPGVTYKWSNDSTSRIITVKPNLSQAYNVTVSDNIGCSGSSSVVVTVINTIPSIKTNRPVICLGQSDTIFAGGGDTYLWNYNNATTSNIIVSPTVTTTYTVTVGLFGCNSKDSLTITVNPLPPAGFAGSDQTICLNSITILSVTGTYSKYSWSTGEPIQTINPMPTTTTAYYVTVTDANGCSNTDEVNIFVNPLPVAFAGNDTGVCYGNSVPLLATGGNKYDWSPATGLSDITIANPVANPTTTTQYTVTVTDTITTCSATSNVTVVIYPLPIAFAGADDRICLGDSLQLLGTMGTSYVWSPSVGLSDSLISNPKASPAITTTYSLTVTDEHSCSASASMVLTVNSLPKAFAGNDTAVCIGSSITLAAANAGSFYSWSTGDVSQTTTITPNITATYTLVTTDTLYGCSASDNVVVVVNSLPDANAGANVKICNGASTVLNATGAGLNGIYSWSPDDSLSAVNISNPTAKPSKSTTYYVTVTDVNGCSASDSTIVYLPVSIIAGGNKSICYGDTIQLKGQGGVAYYWSTTETSQNINVAPKVTTNFILMTTDSLGCTANDTINVFVNSLPLAFTKDTAICNGVITKIGTTGGISYNWSTNEITDSIYVAPTITSAYYVTVTDKNSCSNIDTLNVKVFINPDVKVSKDTAICYLTSTVISAIGGVSYHWYPASGLSDSLTASPVAKPVNTTTYQVFVTDANGCTGSNYTVVNINPLPFAFAGPDTNICHFSSAVLHATGGIKYHWNNGLDTSDIKVTPLDTTQYTVTVTDNNGCSAKDSITVNVINLPVVTVTKDTAICKGTQIELDANCKCYSNTDCARSFSWSDGTNKQYTIVTPMDTTKYIVVAADFYGCINKDSVTVFVKPLPAHNVIRKDSICIGANINLIATGGVSYLWNNKMTNDTINVAPLIDSTYIVTITNVYNCVTVDTNVVKVNPLPTVFIGNDTTVCAMTYLPLTATGGIIYKWNSGDVLATMHATIYQDTTFTVTVTNEFGCDASKSINIKSKPLPVVNATATAMTICHGTTDTLSTAAIGTYSWSTGDTTSKISVLPDSSKTYYIKVSLNGCDVLDSVNINVKPFAVPVITTIGNNTTAFCDSASVKVKLGLKSTYDNYQWGTGANTPTIDITIPGKYYVEVSDNNACAATSDTINVIVYPTIKPVIVSIRKTTFCERDYDMLTLNTKYYTYQWSSGSTTDSIRVIEKGNYNVTVTDFNNCVMAASPVNILVDPLPVPDFTFYDSLLYVQFYNLSNYGVSYTWDFRDGTTSNIANPTHIFPKQGAYQVMLIVHNGCGEDTIIKQVDVWNLTGIRNVEGISNVNVFPNPTKDNVTVRFVSINNQPLNIKMYNVIGDIVRSEELDNFTGEYTKIYDMSTLARGVYFLKINTERGVIVKKIVKD